MHYGGSILAQGLSFRRPLLRFIIQAIFAALFRRLADYVEKTGDDFGAHIRKGRNTSIPDSSDYLPMTAFVWSDATYELRIL